ncbi:MAG: 2-amino-4-hydroxy-6-hydroxymethyldihydropteridine diphosphokinase [Bacteroidota bacterium]
MIATRAFIGLGSNLGDREALLDSAFTALERVGTVRRSRLHESEAVTLDSKPRPPYLNAVAEVQTTLSPLELLDACLAIERAYGRIREANTRWESRTLDLDVLLYGGYTIQSNRLSIPHPHLHRRLFVLAPLAELAPDFWVPPPVEETVQTLFASLT